MNFSKQFHYVLVYQKDKIEYDIVKKGRGKIKNLVVHPLSTSTETEARNMTGIDP